MVPRLTRPDRPGDLTIHYHPYKRDEAMHGVGLRRKSGLQLCPRAVDAREKQFRSNRTFDVLVSENDDIVSVFGREGVVGQRIVDMVDVMIPGYCQGEHLPCRYTDRSSGAQKCMTMESMTDMKVCALYLFLSCIFLTTTLCILEARGHGILQHLRRLGWR